MSDPRDVSGVWYGRWDSDNPAIYPNGFIAVLEEIVGAVNGTTSEPDPHGDTLRAAVSGTRHGASIEWVKQYDRSGRLGHAVHYRGTVNDDATAIDGSWSMARYRGRFTMQREKFSVEALEAEEAVVVTLR